MIRVVMPGHLRSLAGVAGEILVEVASPVTVETVVDAIEQRYPMLKGTIRNHVTKVRRPFIRFFACAEDLSLEPTDRPLPAPVVSGAEPLLVVGAIAGG